MESRFDVSRWTLRSRRWDVEEREGSLFNRLGSMPHCEGGDDGSPPRQNEVDDVKGMQMWTFLTSSYKSAFAVAVRVLLRSLHV